MTLTSIRDWYAQRNGTVNGVPLMHISANIAHADSLQPQCDEFINDLGITVPANDYGPLQTNAVHDLFAPSGTKPVFAIINCVSNSPSHRYNELLLNQVAAPGSGTQSDWDAAMVQWRALIDSIPPNKGLISRANFPRMRLIHSSAEAQARAAVCCPMPIPVHCWSKR